MSTARYTFLLPWGLAVLSGLLLGLSQPKVDWAFLAWFAWVPLILAVRGRPAAEVFRYAFVTHVVAFAILLYWIEVVVRVFGEAPFWLAWIPFLLLTLYCALWMSLGFWWARRIELRFPRLNILWTLPVLLTAFEWVRGRLFTGFPWGHPTYSQYEYLSVIQIADVVGIDGILFVLVFSSVGLVAAGDWFRHRRGGMPAVVALILLATTLLYGQVRLRSMADLAERSEQSLRVGLLQGNIAQHEKWDGDFRTRTLDIYDRLSTEAADRGAELLIWPETAAPFYYRPRSSAESVRVERMAQDTGTYKLFGAPALEMRDGRPRHLNRAYLLDPNADLLGYYDKIHLVPFGEYLPLPMLFGWIERLVPAVGNFAKGERYRVLAVPGGRFGTLICFESIFPAESREFVRNGADFLAVITNDAWFLETSATYQHIGIAVLRAVENRVPVVQAANTGVTAVIDQDGTLRPALPLFEEGALVETLYFERRETFYTRFGDVFAYGTLMLTALSFIGVWRKRRQGE